jgi:hypothetical protein
MGAQLNKLKAYHDAVSEQGSSAPIRILLSDADALALVKEVGPSMLTHADAAADGAKLLSDSLAEKQRTGDALLEYVDRRRAAVAKFWDAIQGQVINGVEILRKPS